MAEELTLETIVPFITEPDRVADLIFGQVNAYLASGDPSELAGFDADVQAVLEGERNAGMRRISFNGDWIWVAAGTVEAYAPTVCLAYDGEATFETVDRDYTQVSGDPEMIDASFMYAILDPTPARVFNSPPSGVVKGLSSWGFTCSSSTGTELAGDGAEMMYMEEHGEDFADVYPEYLDELSALAASGRRD